MIDDLIDKLKRQLASIPLENWENSLSHNSDNIEIIQWLPLLQISPEFSLGLVKNGCWVKDSGVSVTIFEPGKPMVFLLPCLELKYDDFRSMIESAFLRLGLSKELAYTFPSSDLVCIGLTIDSKYWSELALNWAEAIRFDEKVKQALIQAGGSGSTQKIRQRAKKILRDQQRKAL